MEDAFTSPECVIEYLSSYSTKRQEHFIVLTLNGVHKLIKKRVVTIGIANKTIVHPREVFWNAIKDNATAIIIAHNHPSGEVTPSSEDLEITKRIKQSGELLGIEVLDHVIIGKGTYYSFAENGRL